MANVLIIEDEETDRLLLFQALTRAGHHVFFAHADGSLLLAYRENRIDVVVTDLVVPGLGGLDVIRDLKEVDPNACIVAISGRSREHLDRARQLGAIATLEKPIDRKALLDTVAAAAERRSRTQDPWYG